MKKALLLVLVGVSMVNCEIKPDKQDENKNYIQTETKVLDTVLRFSETSKEVLRFSLSEAIEKHTLTTFTNLKQNSLGTIVKVLNGPEGGRYYLFELDSPYKYELKNESKQATFLILAEKHAKYPLGYGVKDVKVNVAGIKDLSLLKDSSFDWDNAFFIGEFLVSAL
ncbi:MAG: hypothetical protein COB81_03845 [Flavobacteriaceae bacterium]|nr:MAG: hypothetical protein COB81_03845 [Flavobacteriaceae bacterium]